MIGIRVDVNQTIATGHIKRDIAIALCLRQMGQECIFLSADKNCLSYLSIYNFQNIILNSQWNNMDGELDVIKRIIAEYDITSLLVDSYAVTETYMKQLKKLTVVTYFDELGKFGFGCQQIINGVLEPPDYSTAVGRALLGPNYVSLRQEFADLPPKKVNAKLKKVMITSGGTDNYHFCINFIDYILRQPQWEELQIIVAIGEMSTDKDLLIKKYQNESRIMLYINTNKMASLMQEADYIITAGGTTLYEVCAAGTVASCYSIADNQIQIAQSFHKNKLIDYAGDFRNEPLQTMQRLLQNMEHAKGKEFRENQACKLQKLVDGKGAWRIAEALINPPII